MQVIHGIDLEVDDGEFCVFVGPSGCGKSTLLRMVAGLEDTTEVRQINIGARDVTQAQTPRIEALAMVFQTYALYPHMTVEQNMGFGLRDERACPRPRSDAKVAEAASDLLKLDPYLERKPAELSLAASASGSAIGRAIVRGPEVFLFDEPLVQPRCRTAGRDAGRDCAICTRRSARR